MADAPKNRKPDNTRFKQQTLPAWTPTLTPNSVVGCFGGIGVPFIAIGVCLLAATNAVVEHELRYDQKSECKISSQDAGVDCTLSFDITEDMDGPVYVYYQLTNFYQNHRTYVKSRSDTQLLGSQDYLADACDPLTTVKINGSKMDLWPCGLVANSLFNDVITLTTDTVSDGSVSLKETGIAWDTDVEYKFMQPDGFKATIVDCADIATCADGGKCSDAICDANDLASECRGYTCSSLAEFDKGADLSGAGKCAEGSCAVYYYPKDDATYYLHEIYPQIVSPLVGVKNEHFVVWMRTAGLPEFRKLYGKIDADLKKGDTITFNVNNNFYVGGFKGTKSLVLTTLSWAGGANHFLGVAYVTVGVICLVLALLFLFKQLTNPRKLGDPRYLQWNDDK